MIFVGKYNRQKLKIWRKEKSIMHKVNRYIKPYVLDTARCSWVISWLKKHNNAYDETNTNLDRVVVVFMTNIRHKTLMFDIYWVHPCSFVIHESRNLQVYTRKNFSNVNNTFLWDTNKVTVSASLCIQINSKLVFGNCWWYVCARYVTRNQITISKIWQSLAIYTKHSGGTPVFGSIFLCSTAFVSYFWECLISTNPLSILTR